MKIIFLAIILSLSIVLKAQENAINEYSTIKYDNSFSYGLNLHTNGWGLNTQYFKSWGFNNNFIFNFDILGLKHPKETKVVNPTYSDARPYVYGKMNSAFLLRPGIGNQFIIADKETALSIRINLNVIIGMDFTLLKPEYLYFIYSEPTGLNFKVLEKFDVSNPHHNNQGNIYGRSSFLTGFNDLSNTVGGFGKISLSFEWNDYEEKFYNLETGFMIDAFPQELPIYAYINNKAVFTNFYVQFSIGRRW